jgi:hypothetical protein
MPHAPSSPARRRSCAPLVKLNNRHAVCLADSDPVNRSTYAWPSCTHRGAERAEEGGCPHRCVPRSGLLTPNVPARSAVPPAGPVLVDAYLYRAQSNKSYPIENCNLANLAGIVQYLQTEIVAGTCMHDEWSKGVMRKFQIDRVLRVRVVSMISPRERAWGHREHQYVRWQAFDYGVAKSSTRVRSVGCKKVALGYPVGGSPTHHGLPAQTLLPPPSRRCGIAAALACHVLYLCNAPQLVRRTPHTTRFPAGARHPHSGRRITTSAHVRSRAANVLRACCPTASLARGRSRCSVLSMSTSSPASGASATPITLTSAGARAV